MQYAVGGKVFAATNSYYYFDLISLQTVLCCFLFFFLGALSITIATFNVTVSYVAAISDSAELPHSAFRFRVAPAFSRNAFEILLCYALDLSVGGVTCSPSLFPVAAPFILSLSSTAWHARLSTAWPGSRLLVVLVGLVCALRLLLILELLRWHPACRFRGLSAVRLSSFRIVVHYLCYFVAYLQINLLQHYTLRLSIFFASCLCCFYLRAHTTSKFVDAKIYSNVIFVCDCVYLCIHMYILSRYIHRHAWSTKRAVGRLISADLMRRALVLALRLHVSPSCDPH